MLIFAFLSAFRHFCPRLFWLLLEPCIRQRLPGHSIQIATATFPFLCFRRCPGSDRSAGFCLLYTITRFPLRAKALLRKEKLLPFLLCAASLPSGDVSSSGCRLGRLLQGRAIYGSSLCVPPASFTTVPSACCKKYVGKSCSLASLGLF